MTTWLGKIWGGLALAMIISFNALAATYYVNVSNSVPVAPFTSWATAATNIQDAVDLSADGDLILVTNGLYRTGGKTAGLAATNRVAITNAVTVQSVNGPEVTVIRGYQVPGTITGAAAVRCVYMATNATLSGFTLTNGATPNNSGWGGGVYGLATNLVVTNCIITDNAASQGGGFYGKGRLFDCQLIGNKAALGGGGCYALGNGQVLWLSSCTLAGNTAGDEGGGTAFAWLTNCLLITNSAASGGGGAAGGALDHCTLIGNFVTRSGGIGGGVDSTKMSGCVLIGNHADGGGGASYVYITSGITNCFFFGNYAEHGGGTLACDVFNSVFFTNSASTYGGAAYDCNLYNCVVVSNTATTSGGGVYLAYSGDIIRNSILYYNTAPASANYNNGGNAQYCCIQTFGVAGYLTNEPAFVDWPNGDFHLRTNSPCINAGNSAAVQTTVDLDGNPRVVGYAVDLGVYENSLASILPYSWNRQYGFIQDGSLDYTDSDGDGMNNWQEWISRTVPTNAVSVLKMSSLTNDISGTVVTWQSVNGLTYYLQRSPDLTGGFSSIVSNLVGQAGSTSYTDTTMTNAGPYFYRVGVQ